MNIIEVTDIHGHTHKVDLDNLDTKRFAKNGEVAKSSMMCMDTGGALFTCDSEQLKDHNMTTDEAQKRCDDAYNEMVADLDYRNRNRSPGKPGETPTEAYDFARAELEKAWKQGR